MTTALWFCALTLVADPKTEPLYPGKAPHAVGDSEADKPALTAYWPPMEAFTGAACVVCPGGGYGGLAMNHEGRQVAEWLNKQGIAAFVLKYRIATKDRPRPLHPAPLLDAQRAIRTVRARAKDGGIDPTRIGIWGFSAGGHLASSAATHFDTGRADSDDPIDRQSCRPDYLILAYPVINLGQNTHGGSRRNLLGDTPDEKLIEQFSNHKHVTKETPPTFLFHTAEDKSVVLEHSQLFETACKKAGVPVKLVVYEKGKHGVGLAPQDPILSKWPDQLADWLRERKIIPTSRDR